MPAVTGPFGTPHARNTGANSVNAVTYALDPVAQVGDLWVVTADIPGNATAGNNVVSPPAGWVTLYHYQGVANEGHAYVFGKIITAGDITAGSATFIIYNNAVPPVQVFNNFSGINVGLFRNFDPAAVVDAFSNPPAHSASFIATYTVPALTASRAGDMMLGSMVVDGATGMASALPTGMTLVLEDVGQFIGSRVAYQAIAASGSTGTRVWNVGSRSGQAFGVLLKSVNAIPTVSIAPPGPVSLTTGQSQSFTATATDSDGTIATYSWTKDSGPASPTISAPTSATTVIGPFNTPGTYVHRCSVVDNLGASNFATVTTVVSAASSNRRRTTDMTTRGGGLIPLNRRLHIIGH